MVRNTNLSLTMDYMLSNFKNMIKTKSNSQRILEAKAKMALNAMDALRIYYPAYMTDEEIIAYYKSILTATA